MPNPSPTMAASSNLLGTRTTSFLELVGNGKIYRVPPYQRDYSWEEEQWEDLWADVVELRSAPDASHYMGALVVDGKSDREFQVIDGQQRLATLSLLALAVIAKLHAMADAYVEPDENRERAAGLRARFVGEKDPASLIESSKLFLNETDDAFYQDYLVQLREPRNPRGLPRSNRLLWECFRYFRARLNEEPAFGTDGAALATLLSETVGRQLMFILITVADELNAYTVFETLNARGLELSTTDLLKNYLFSRAPTSADLDALRRRWRTLVGIIKQEQFPELLRFHLQCEIPMVRSGRIFKLVRERVKTPAHVFALMEVLESRAELFAALGDPNHSYWIDRPGCKPYVRDLVLFRVRQMTPLLFVTWERFSPDDFERVLRFVSVLSFRYTVVSGLNPSALEMEYHRAAKAVLNGDATRAGQVARRLDPVYVDDERFEQDFARLELNINGQRKKLAKYVLARLEAGASGRGVDPDTDPATVEHVLPQNPSGGWSEDFPADKWDAYVYRLGNLTLLESALNREAGQAVYRDKAGMYARSKYALAREVAEYAPDEWSPAHVDERQRRLATRAVTLWRSDFA